MKIAVNARLLNKPFTGMGQHTLYIFREMARLNPSDKFILIVHEDVDDNVRKFFPKNVTIKVIPEKKRGSAGIKKTWWEQISVPEFMKEEKVDIAYFTYPSNPWTNDWYKKNGIKTVVTVHDCIPWKHKEYQRGIMSKMYHKQTQKAVKKADIVFTVSKYSKKDILKYCKAKTDQVKVVYNDVADEYKMEVDSGVMDIVLKKFELERQKYFIYCGGFDLRKNVKVLIEEYYLFAEKCEKEGVEIIPLVLVGDKLFDNELYAGFDDKSRLRAGKIVQTGFVAEKELAAFYAGSLAFVHLSKDEGFNIPLLEAANARTALILSDIEVHQEIAGKGAEYVNVANKGECAEKMYSLLREDKREMQAEAAKLFAGDYLWERSAMRVYDELKNL